MTDELYAMRFEFSGPLSLLDDIIVYWHTFTDYLQRLYQLFIRLIQAHLQLKPSKCFLLQMQLDFLGHVTFEKGMTSKERKINTVHDWPVPHTKRFADSSDFVHTIGDFTVIAASLPHPFSLTY